MKNTKVHAIKHRQALWQAIMSLKSTEECERFFTDLCTPGELNDFIERWWIARLLNEGKLSYREIAAETGGSTTTVGRVARFLGQEQHQGYRMMLSRMGYKKAVVGKKRGR